MERHRQNDAQRQKFPQRLRDLELAVFCFLIPTVAPGEIGGCPLLPMHLNVQRLNRSHRLQQFGKDGHHVLVEPTDPSGTTAVPLPRLRIADVIQARPFSGDGCRSYDQERDP